MTIFIIVATTTTTTATILCCLDGCNVYPQCTTVESSYVYPQCTTVESSLIKKHACNFQGKGHDLLLFLLVLLLSIYSVESFTQPDHLSWLSLNDNAQIRLRGS